MKPLRLALYALFSLASLALLLRAFLGPFFFLLPVHSRLNAASLASLSLLLLLLTTRPPPAETLPVSPFPLARLDALALAALILAAFASFSISIPAPFLFDDYTHLAQLSSWSLSGALAPFVHPSPGAFFRPASFLFSWLEFHCAGLDPLRWHLFNLTLHAANTVLVFLAARLLLLSRRAALPAALVFALHGSRFESVAWADASFDLWAAFFTLLTLLAVLAYRRSAHPLWLAAAAPLAAAALLSKESAFCLPFLVLALIPFSDRSTRPRLLRAAALVALLTALAFLYRWHMLSGLGGYPSAPSHALPAALFHAALFHAAKALLYRLWAFLLVPWNWSRPPEWWLSLSLAAFLAALLIAARSTFSGLRRFAPPLLFTLAASLPVEHLLLLNPSFAGARLLYLPVLGWALLAGALAASLGAPVPRRLFLATLAAFSLASLHHNLIPWTRTAYAARAACLEFARDVPNTAQPVSVSNLPATRHGVYFLANGFPQCVALYTGLPASRILVLPPGQPAAPGLHYAWNPASRTFRAVSTP